MPVRRSTTRGGQPSDSHTTRRLLAAQVAASVALPAGATAGGLLAVDIAGASAAALPLALLVIGSGAAAVLTSGATARWNRRTALQGAYLAAALGAALIAGAAGAADLPLLLAGSALLGAGNAAAMLARYTAADLAPPGRRGHALSRMLLALTVGAVAAPNLLGPAAVLSRPLALPPAAGLFLLAAASLLLAAALLPPLPDPPRATTRPGRPRRATWPSWGPLSVLAGANLSMVTVMAVIPPLLHTHGTPLAHVGLLVSVHVAAMYAPAPLAGRAVDRFGPRPVAATGALFTLLAGLIGLHEDITQPLPAAAALLLVGLAWSAQVVAGSTWLTRSVPDTIRAKSEGLGEAGMSVAAAAGGLAAGPTLAAGGVPAILAAVITTAVGLLVVTALSRSARPQATGRPETARAESPPPL